MKRVRQSRGHGKAATTNAAKSANQFVYIFDKLPISRVCPTDKETDESWDIFIILMKNQFWAGLGSQAVHVKKILGTITQKLKNSKKA